MPPSKCYCLDASIATKYLRHPFAPSPLVSFITWCYSQPYQLLFPQSNVAKDHSWFLRTMIEEQVYVTLIQPFLHRDTQWARDFRPSRIPDKLSNHVLQGCGNTWFSMHTGSALQVGLTIWDAVRAFLKIWIRRVANHGTRFLSGNWLNTSTLAAKNEGGIGTIESDLHSFWGNLRKRTESDFKNNDIRVNISTGF